MKFISVDFLKEDIDTINPIYRDIIRNMKRIIDAQPMIDIEISEELLNEWRKKYRGREYGNRKNN